MANVTVQKTRIEKVVIELDEAEAVELTRTLANGSTSYSVYQALADQLELAGVDSRRWEEPLGG